MAPSLFPANIEQMMVIRDIVPKMVTTLSVPFNRFGKIRFGGRGTIVRMQTGALAVFSPVALTPDVKNTLSLLGEVKYITALDIEHHIYLGPWHNAFPNAKVIGPEGLYEKRKKQGNEDVPFSVIFTPQNKDSIKVDPEFDAEFDYTMVDAHVNKELVFNHKPSRTLIEADLIFNLPATEQFSKSNQSATDGILTKIFTYIGQLGPHTLIRQKRFMWHLASRRDRLGFSRSMAKINSWDFDKIIPCHGDVVESNGKRIFEQLTEWHLDLAKKSS